MSKSRRRMGPTTPASAAAAQLPTPPPPRRPARLRRAFAILAVLAIAGVIAVLVLLARSDGLPDLVLPDSLDRADPDVRELIAFRHGRALENPKDGTAQADFALALAANGFWGEARPAFERAATLAKDDPLAEFYRARASIDVNDDADAKKRLESVIARWPRFGPAHYLLGTMLADQGDLDAAAGRFRALVTIEADQSAWGRAGLANVLIQQGKAEQAAALLEPVVERDRSFALAQHLLGTAYRVLKKPDLAARHLAAGVQAKAGFMPDPWSSRLSAEARSLSGRVAEAQALRAIGKTGDAIAILERARQGHPDDLDLLSNLGALYLSRDDFDRARESLARAASLNRNHFPTLFNLALVETKTGRVEAALGYSLRAVDVAPTHARAHEVHSDVLAAMDRREEAITSMKKAVALDPRSAQLRLRLGGLLSRFGRLAEAKGELEASLGIDATNPNTWMVLCEVCLDMKLATDAARAYQRARAIAPTAPELAVLERRLRALGGG